ncbi:sigma-70 family RNA polymerase sigma factor [Caldibacillus debilis]|uniref:RNA polymerase sigma factor, sigma-70 family n=1 Tax=Caldibacillus debilis GB1 TaxID=1339248 RepID=A0A420VEC9_9BACI|nr:sigma-70 family RNA polymerase sigma factor [Caldibacillus debilis]RKO61870.1 RNA polymerase sigma factor, sigma-70 family [Caldibacillus debilis GB1]
MPLLTEEEKNRMAEENLQLVHFVANKFRNTRIDYDDLYGAAMFGFTKALNSFDKDRGAKFSTYAVNCMKNEVRFFLRKERRQSDHNISYNLVLSTDKNGNDFELYNILADNSDGAKEVSDLLVRKENHEMILRAVSQLSELEQYIINHRYGLKGCEFKTQKEIAAEINMSQANVSKIQKNCMKKIKKFLMSENEQDLELFEEHFDQYAS